MNNVSIDVLNLILDHVSPGIDRPPGNLLQTCSRVKEAWDTGKPAREKLLWVDLLKEWGVTRTRAESDSEEDEPASM